MRSHDHSASLRMFPRLGLALVAASFATAAALGSWLLLPDLFERVARASHRQPAVPMAANHASPASGRASTAAVQPAEKPSTEPSKLGPPRPDPFAEVALAPRTPPRPGRALGTRPLQIATHIDLPWSKITAAIEARVPGPVVATSKGWRNDQKYEVRRGAIKLAMNGEHFEWSVPLTIKASGRRRIFGNTMTRSCKAAATLAFRTRVDVGKDWRVQSRTSVEKLEWRRPCKISIVDGFTVDLTQMLDRELKRRQREVARGIDQRLPSALQLRSSVTRAWRQAHAITPVAPDLGLELRPQALTLEGWRGHDRSMRIVLGLRARPRLHWGRHATESGAVPPLPPLRRGKVGAPGWSGELELVASAKTLESSARSALQKAPMLTAAGPWAVENIELRGVGPRMEVSAELPAVGARLIADARPAWNARTGKLELDEVRWVEGSFAHELAPMLGTGLVGLPKLIEREAGWSPRARLQSARSRLDDMLDHTHAIGGTKLRSRGQVDALEITKVAMGPAGLHVVLRTRGRVCASLR